MVLRRQGWFIIRPALLYCVMVIIWDKQPEPNYAPIVIEEPVEEFAIDEEEEDLVEEVKRASGFTFKGFGS